MDTLLTEVPHFPYAPRDTESITSGLAARAQNLMGNMSCFVPLSRRSQLGIRCNKELFAI